MRVVIKEKVILDDKKVDANENIVVDIYPAIISNNMIQKFRKITSISLAYQIVPPLFNLDSIDLNGYL